MPDRCDRRLCQWSEPRPRAGLQPPDIGVHHQLWGTYLGRGAGFRADTLETLIGRYAAGAAAPTRSFELRLLANRLYDLTVLGLWLEREGITT
jgi:hypothetical protein